MVKKYKLINTKMDINTEIARHSADIVVTYKKVEAESIYLGYYLPREYEADKKYPVFIFVHGGGLTDHKVFNDQETWAGDYLGYLARYYAEHGFLCVSIDYRLARNLGQTDNYSIIDCYEDCCDAVDYVIAHAQEYGANLSEIYLLGESAGGYLAGALATFHFEKRYTFNKVFLVNPMTHLYDGWKSRVPIHSKHPKLKKLDLEEKADFLSPLYQLNENCSEVVLFHGDLDQVVNIEHSKLFYEKMIELKVPCELHIFENTRHAFILAEYYKFGLEACKMAIGIIDNILKIK